MTTDQTSRDRAIPSFIARESRRMLRATNSKDLVLNCIERKSIHPLLRVKYWNRKMRTVIQGLVLVSVIDNHFRPYLECVSSLIYQPEIMKKNEDVKAALSIMTYIYVNWSSSSKRTDRVRRERSV